MAHLISTQAGKRARRETDRLPQVRLGGVRRAPSQGSGGLRSNPCSATRSWVPLGKSFLLSGSDQQWFQAGAPAPWGTWPDREQSGGRVQTFIGPEQVLLVIENIIFIFRKLRCIMKYNAKIPLNAKNEARDLIGNFDLATCPQSSHAACF